MKCQTRNHQPIVEALTTEKSQRLSYTVQDRIQSDNMNGLLEDLSSQMGLLTTFFLIFREVRLRLNVTMPELQYPNLPDKQSPVTNIQ